MRQRLRFPVLLLLSALPFALAPRDLPAQSPTGKIVGRVVDAEHGSGIAGAVIEVIGSALQAQSGIDGRYTLNDVPAGQVSLRTRYIGFQPKVVTGVLVAAGAGTTQDIALSVQVVELEEITVAAAAEQGTVSRALEEQRSAENIINAISAEQISRSPDGDAGQAVQRVSGVTVQDGKYVFVRGLGERYTTTSLNGARLPSAEPERKVVPLDLFPSNLLEAITTSKTFTPDQSGDFSGASVNLKTREFPLRRVITFSTSVGVNSAATGQDLLRAPRTGREWLAVAGSERSLPAEIAAAGTLGGVSTSERNRLLSLFRNSWSARDGTGTPNGSLGVSVGGEDPLFGQPVGYLASLTYSATQEIREQEYRSTIDGSSLLPGGSPISEYRGGTSRSSVLYGGLLNLSSRVGTGTRISLNNSYTRGGDNEAAVVRGPNRDWGDLELTRLTFVERSVRSNQALGEHLVGGRHQIGWSVTSSAVRRNEPDRSDLVYETVPFAGGSRQVWSTAPQAATRAFSDLAEDAWEYSGQFRYAFDVAGQNALKVGLLHRRVSRDANSRAYDISQNNLTDDERAQPAEVIFDGTYALAGRLRLTANVNGGRYDAEDRLTAGFAQFELQLLPRLRAVGGLRVEQDQLEVRTRETQSATIREARLDDTDFLPALALTYSLSDDQNLRFAATQTLSRPEYRELAPVRYFDILGNLPVRGNENLQRALIRNLDARWEWFPRTGEVVSLGVFAKFFDRPIERVFVLENPPGLSFANAKSATNYGVELELRKNLDVVAAGLRHFSLFTNATLMQSRITPGDDSLSASTSKDRSMVGQSDYVVNAGLGFTSPSGAVYASVLYNVVGERIAEASPRPLPDTYEKARHVVDLSLQLTAWSNWRFRLDAKNVLDSPYRLSQGDFTRLRYLSGRQFGFGVSVGL